MEGRIVILTLEIRKYVLDATKSKSSETQEKTLQSVSEKVLYQISDLKKLDYLIKSELFLEEYNKTTNKVEIDFHLNNLDYTSVKLWLHRKQSLNYESLPVHRLREIARRKGIKEYNVLRRHELIERIVKRNDREN